MEQSSTGEKQATIKVTMPRSPRVPSNPDQQLAAQVTRQKHIEAGMVASVHSQLSINQRNLKGMNNKNNLDVGVPTLARTSQESGFNKRNIGSNSKPSAQGRLINNKPGSRAPMYSRVSSMASNIDYDASRNLEVVGSCKQPSTYLGMPMEHDDQKVSPHTRQPSRAQKRQLKDLNDQIESEITAYQRENDASATHRPLRIRALQEEQETSEELATITNRTRTGSRIEKHDSTKKTDLLNKLNNWQRERTENAMITQVKSSARGHQYELHPINGGMQLIRQVLPLDQVQQSLDQNPCSLTGRKLDTTARFKNQQRQIELLKRAVGTGNSVLRNCIAPPTADSNHRQKITKSKTGMRDSGTDSQSTNNNGIVKARYQSRPGSLVQPGIFQQQMNNNNLTITGTHQSPPMSPQTALLPSMMSQTKYQATTMHSALQEFVNHNQALNHQTQQLRPSMNPSAEPNLQNYQQPQPPIHPMSQFHQTRRSPTQKQQYSYQLNNSNVAAVAPQQPYNQAALGQLLDYPIVPMSQQRTQMQSQGVPTRRGRTNGTNTAHHGAPRHSLNQKPVSIQLNLQQSPVGQCQEMSPTMISNNGPKSIRFERVSVQQPNVEMTSFTNNTLGMTQGRFSLGRSHRVGSQPVSLEGGRTSSSLDKGAQLDQAHKNYLPSVNRMLVDLKKLDYFSDPNSVLFNLRNTLEECSQKQKQDSLTKLKKIQLGQASRLSTSKNNGAQSPGQKNGGALNSDRSYMSNNSRRTSVLPSQSHLNTCTNCGGSNFNLNSQSQIGTGAQTAGAVGGVQQQSSTFKAQTFEQLAVDQTMLNQQQQPQQQCNCSCRCHATPTTTSPVPTQHQQQQQQQFYAQQQHHHHQQLLIRQQQQMQHQQQQQQVNAQNAQMLMAAQQQVILINNQVNPNAINAVNALKMQQQQQMQLQQQAAKLNNAQVMRNSNQVSSPLRIPIGPNQTQVIVPAIDMSRAQHASQQSEDIGATDRLVPQQTRNNTTVLIQSAETTDRLREDKANISSQKDMQQVTSDSCAMLQQSQAEITHDLAVAQANKDLAVSIQNSSYNFSTNPKNHTAQQLAIIRQNQQQQRQNLHPRRNESSNIQNKANGGGTTESMLSLSQQVEQIGDGNLEGGKYNVHRQSQLKPAAAGKGNSQVQQLGQNSSTQDPNLSVKLQLSNIQHGPVIESGEVDQRQNTNGTNTGMLSPMSPTERKTVFVPAAGTQQSNISTMLQSARPVLSPASPVYHQQNKLIAGGSIVRQSNNRDSFGGKGGQGQGQYSVWPPMPNDEQFTMQQHLEALHQPSRVSSGHQDSRRPSYDYQHQAGCFTGKSSTIASGGNTGGAGHYRSQLVDQTNHNTQYHEFDHVDSIWNRNASDEYDIESEERDTHMDLASVHSIKQHYSRIQMEYYDEPRQYNHIMEESIRFPTNTNLVEIAKPGKLKFTQKREHADVDVSLMSYHDQKEFFRLDRQHDKVLIDQHEYKTKKTLNQVGKALNANLNKERMSLFKQFLNDEKHQQLRMNSLCLSSRIPRVALTNKSIALQNNQIGLAAEKSIRSQQRDDDDIYIAAESVENRLFAPAKTQKFTMSHNDSINQHEQSQDRQQQQSYMRRRKVSKERNLTEQTIKLNKQSSPKTADYQQQILMMRQQKGIRQQAEQRVRHLSHNPPRQSKTPNTTRSKIYKGVPSRIQSVATKIPQQPGYIC